MVPPGDFPCRRRPRALFALWGAPQCWLACLRGGLAARNNGDFSTVRHSQSPISTLFRCKNHTHAALARQVQTDPAILDRIAARLRISSDGVGSLFFTDRKDAVGSGYGLGAASGCGGNGLPRMEPGPFSFPAVPKRKLQISGMPCNAAGRTVRSPGCRRRWRSLDWKIPSGRPEKGTCTVPPPSPKFSLTKARVVGIVVGQVRAW